MNATIIIILLIGKSQPHHVIVGVSIHEGKEKEEEGEEKEEKVEEEEDQVQEVAEEEE